MKVTKREPKPKEPKQLRLGDLRPGEVGESANSGDLYLMTDERRLVNLGKDGSGCAILTKLGAFAIDKPLANNRRWTIAEVILEPLEEEGDE